ncbi:cationic amino acid transporter isoform B [Chlorella sorokiniana]|uniref:Cationic amino acid transporter isoform B n=1 Tax=Chlorella sorokiniana TaxID=3076 RepID=A0A2P6TKD4_CHLSO|nr:cationic amino acid transporter isoform B [Chlorella sorokiniana]|eukprot:PRW44539.1 cationic amino acid transporter isoform B [Chlorella sorokiniana]
MHEAPDKAAAAPAPPAAAAALPRRLQEWAGALARLPQLLATMAFRRRSLQDELEEAALGGTLRRSLSALDLWCLGMGQAIASGIFNLTGGAALQAGSAILLSYLLAGATALCCAAVMAEFARELPISGAGFTWTITTLGELPAMFVLGNTLAAQASALCSVLGNAAVSRGFSYFLAQLCGRPPTFFNVGSTSVNPVAFGINVVITCLVATGVRESAFFITGLTLLHLLMLSIVMIAGFTQADPSNLQPFFSGGADNCIDAAGILFFTFIGMEAPAVGAEEARNPAQLPAAIIGNASVAVVVYIFMALSLLMMVPVTQVGTPAVPVSPAAYRANAFTAAFSAAGLGHWNSFVLVTAMLGTVTSLVTLMYSCSSATAVLRQYQPR